MEPQGGMRKVIAVLSATVPYYVSNRFCAQKREAHVAAWSRVVFHLPPFTPQISPEKSKGRSKGDVWRYRGKGIVPRQLVSCVEVPLQIARRWLKRGLQLAEPYVIELI
jgi:hypothetical protein